jgi:hypothetical protein
MAEVDFTILCTTNVGITFSVASAYNTSVNPLLDDFGP